MREFEKKNIEVQIQKSVETERMQQETINFGKIRKNEQRTHKWKKENGIDRKESYRQTNEQQEKVENGREKFPRKEEQVRMREEGKWNQ